MKPLALALVAVLIASQPVAAHEAEHTAVRFTFSRDGSFLLEVSNDPKWLPLRLESFADDTPHGVIQPEVRLRNLAQVFVDRIVIFVDGHEIRPSAIEYLPPEPTSGDGPTTVVIYRMRGRVAPDARSLRWYYGLVLDPYPLTI